MRSFKVIALALLLLPTLALAQKKTKKPSVPEVFNQARLVYVQAADGEEFKPGLPLEDRLAIADVRDALRAWGRYTFTPEREKADLIFVVRKGRPAGSNLNGDNNGGPGRGGSGIAGPGMEMPSQQGTPHSSQERPGTGMGVGDEAGFEEDMLEVCQLNANGKLSRPLWARSMQNGLNRPQLLLFTQLKEAVEKTYPKAPDAPSAKP